MLLVLDLRYFAFAMNTLPLISFGQLFAGQIRLINLSDMKRGDRKSFSDSVYVVIIISIRDHLFQQHLCATNAHYRHKHGCIPYRQVGVWKTGAGE